MAERPKYKCPVCGDPNVFKLWVDPRPPLGCPDDDSWHEGGPPTIKDVTQCAYQMGKAWQAAEFRKLVPDAFDGSGAMKPGRLVDVLRAFGDAHPNKALVI